MTAKALLYRSERISMEAYRRDLVVRCEGEWGTFDGAYIGVVFAPGIHYLCVAKQ